MNQLKKTPTFRFEPPTCCIESNGITTTLHLTFIKNIYFSLFLRKRLYEFKKQKHLIVSRDKLNPFEMPK